MGLTAKASGNGPQVLVEPGTYVARCYQIVDMGTQKTTFKGQEKDQHQVKFSWELPTEMHVFNEEKGPQPLAVHSTFTLSLNEKSNLSKMLTGWMNRKFTETEMSEGFDVKKFLGKACLVSIIHTNKGDKTYANISNVTPMMKGQVCPPAINKPIGFGIGDAGCAELFSQLPQFLQDKIVASPEWQEYIGESPSKGIATGSTDDMDEF